MKSLGRIGTLAESLYLRWFNAEIYKNDEPEEKYQKMNRIVLLRTLFAINGFIIAILTIVIGSFTDGL